MGRADAGELRIPARRACASSPTGEDDALVYTSGSALRDDVKSPGYFVFAPARLPDGGTVVVNRGYVPDKSDRARCAGAQEIVGALRWPEAPSWFVSAATAPGVWYVRDHRAMAAQQRLGRGRAVLHRAGGAGAARRAAASGPAQGPACATIICNTRSPGTASPPCWW